MKEAQESGALDDVILRLGPYEKRVNLKIPVAFIIGDSQGGDYVVGRSPYYNGRKAKRVCRTCNAGVDTIDKTERGICQRIIQADMQILIDNNDEAALKNLMTAPVQNAFMKLNYGGSPFGIYTAAMPTEPLHQFENGVMKNCLTQLFTALMMPATRPKLDAIVMSFCFLPNQRYTKSYMETYPRLTFHDGITSLSDTTAQTIVGFMFACVVAGLTRDGRYLFMHEVPRMGEECYFNMIETFESLLCFWAWLKKDKYWKCSESDEMLVTVEEATFTLMRKVKDLWPRETGCEWKTPKFHETSHNAFNIYLFGKPANWHSGPTEHNHISTVKQPANITQKRRKLFDWQLANRLIDKYIIDKAVAIIETPLLSGNQNVEAGETIQQNTDMAGKFLVKIWEGMNRKIQVKYQWQTHRKHQYTVDDSVIEAIVDYFFKTIPRQERLKGIQVMGYTEYRRDNVIFRAHPKYRNERAWYDYAMLAWEGDAASEPAVPDDDEFAMDDSSSDNGDEISMSQMLQQSVELENNQKTKNVQLVPAQLKCFVQLQTEKQDQPYLAIVHSCYGASTKIPPTRVSVLTNRWRLEYTTDTDSALEKKTLENYDEEDSEHDEDIEPAQYRADDNSDSSIPLLRFVSVDIIEKHCLMMPYHMKSRYLMQVIDFDKWGSRFLDEDNP